MRGRRAERDVGADDYLHRPFTRAQLLARVRTGANPCHALVHDGRRVRHRPDDGHAAAEVPLDRRSRDRSRDREDRLLRLEQRPDLAERFGVVELPTLVIVESKKVRAKLEKPRGCREIESFLSPWLR